MSINLINNDNKSVITRSSAASSSQGFNKRNEKVKKLKLLQKLVERFSEKYGKNKPME